MTTPEIQEWIESIDNKSHEERERKEDQYLEWVESYNLTTPLILRTPSTSSNSMSTVIQISLWA